MAGLHGNQFGTVQTLLFGDGSDGDAVVSGSIFINRDMFYKNLTVKKGVTYYTNGHRIRVAETLTIEGDGGGVGVIANNGQNARNSNGQGTEVSGSSVPGTTPGAPKGSTGGGGVGGCGMYNGGYGSGNTDHPIASGSTQNIPAVNGATAPFYFLGGRGGNGGQAYYLTGPATKYVYRGEPGASGTINDIQGGYHGFFTVVTAGVIGNVVTGTGSFNIIAGGGGGGGGACANSGSVGVRPRSGWGGGGGGVVYVAAKDVILNGRIEAKGGNGGNTFGRAASGGGGGGGIIFLIYSRLRSRLDVNSCLVVNGGIPGIGQVAAGVTPPETGSIGKLLLFEV